YQSCGELRADLARWTEPEKVRAILGSEADAARAFRPPPPEIDDDDLRLLSDDGSGGTLGSLRDLGDAEPAPPPVHRPPPAPVPPVLIPPGAPRKPAAEVEEPTPAAPPDDSRWLIQFIAVAVILGLLVVLAITLFA